MTTPGWVFRTASVLALVVGLGGAAVALWVGASMAQLRADADAKESAADGVVDVGFALRTTLNDAATLPDDGATLSFPEAQEQGVPLRDLVRARDTGEPTLSETGVVIVARYSTPAPPPDVAARRQAITGVQVVPVPLRSVLADIAPDDGGIAVMGPERPVAQAPTPVPQGAVSHTVELPPTLVTGWTVLTWSPDPGVPAAAWAAALTLLLAGLGAAGLVERRYRLALRAAADLARDRRHQETLASLAAVAQRSLDLAEVLPAVATQLSDALGLRGLRLSDPAASVDRSLFVTGQVGEVAHDTPYPQHLAAGDSTSMLLARGGRTVARLTVTAGRDLDEGDMATLRSAADLLTPALANAETFSQQRELLARMREVDDLKTVFLATASHELRTPVGIINGFARLLVDNVGAFTPEQTATYAERVEANARQLSELVDNLLDFSRLERGVRSGGETEVLDLGATVTQVLEARSDLAENHQVVTHAPPGLRVLGTEHAVERVLTNFVGNAGKYSPAGTTIRVRVQDRDGRVELLVDDEGPGVPPAERDQVFSRFYRGGGDAVVNTRGAGLGLAIVREFAQSMRGQVSVEEAPTGGARFIASFPAAEEPAEEPATEPAVEPSAPPPP